MDTGTSEHAERVTEGRHPAVRDGLQWLTYAHLPEQLQKFSEVFYEAAVHLTVRITTDSPELTTAINHLISAKDAAVRAGIRDQTGRAGSVPRPQAVVAPPKLLGHPVPEVPVGDGTCYTCSRLPGSPHASWCGIGGPLRPIKPPRGRD